MILGRAWLRILSSTLASLPLTKKLCISEWNLICDTWVALDLCTENFDGGGQFIVLFTLRTSWHKLNFYPFRRFWCVVWLCFLRCCRILTTDSNLKPTNENTQWYYTPKLLISYSLSNWFIYTKMSSFLFSNKPTHAKHSQPVKKVFFFFFIFLILFTKHDANDIADPSSMQDACDIWAS